MADPQDAFKSMADKIIANTGSKFGGAFVVVPPGGGTPLSVLILDESENPSQLWALLQTKCQISLNELEEKARQNQGFGVR